MSEEDLKEIAAHSAAAITRLEATSFKKAQAQLATCLEQIEHYTSSQDALSLAGARYWASMARVAIGQMQALVAAEG